MNTIQPLITVGIPTWGRITLDWARAFQSIQFPLGCNCYTAAIDDRKMSVADKRNAIVDEAIRVGSSHVFFVADDVLPPNNIVLQLLSRDVDIVTGVYWTKEYPPSPYIWRGVQCGPYRKWKIGEFFEVDMAGCDALLVKTEVFKKLDAPWFNMNWKWEKDHDVSALATEDFPFFLKAKANGYKVWCDASVQCLHEDRGTGVKFGLMSDMPQAQPGFVFPDDEEETVRVCADIGCGSASEYFEGKIVRIDIDESVKPDIRADVRKIPEPDNTFDEVRSSHCLEHFGAEEVPKIVAEWIRVLKLGGTLKITVPDLEWAMKTILTAEEQTDADDDPISDDDKRFAWQIIYGETHKGYYWAHRNGFIARILKNTLGVVGGVKDVNVEQVSYDGRPGFDLVVTATKTHTPNEPDILMDYWNDCEHASDLEAESEAGFCEEAKEDYEAKLKAKVTELAEKLGEVESVDDEIKAAEKNDATTFKEFEVPDAAIEKPEATDEQATAPNPNKKPEPKGESDHAGL